MTDVSPNDLNCGHFGIPAYDLENSQWSFVRTSDGESFRQLDTWEVLIPPAVNFPPPRVPRTLRTARQATKRLCREFPEIVPATEHVSEFEAVSAAATTALRSHDATVGQLLSFGTITPLGNRALHARHVVALPAGEGGNILRLQLLIKEKRGWGTFAPSDTPCYLDCHSWKGDHAFWNQDATAIQQICFAQPERPGSFLAVRLPRRIVLFRPTYYDRPVAASQSRLYGLPPSLIDVRPFHSVWTEDTGGISHADVAFNPHYQRQFAIVDRTSNWSVWDIDGKRRSYTVKRAASGNMEMVRNHSEEPKPSLGREEDGWARIMWVGNANTLLVSNRKQIMLIDLRDLSRSLSVPQLIDWKSTSNPPQHWILDVKRHPLDEKQFFILTSTRLYLLSVLSSSNEPRATFGSTGATIVLSWTHFRGAGDTTLTLYTHSMPDEETTVLICSRLNTLVTVYRFMNQTSVAVPVRSFGPTTLRLDDSDDARKSKTILNFDIVRVQLQNPGNETRGQGVDYQDRGIRFYQLSALFDDLSVAQTMLCSLAHDVSDDTIQKVEPTSWATAIRPVAFRSKVTIDGDEDDFVEPDGILNSKEPLLKPAFQPPIQIQPTSTRIRQGLLNFTSLYEAISSNKPFALHPASSPSENLDLVTLVNEIKWRLGRAENIEPFTLGTLQEYAEAIVTVDDIDDASEKLQELCLTDVHTSSLRLERIASHRILGFGHELHETPSLSSVYDLVLRNWLAPLPETIPARIRQTKERLARRLAIGIVLASTRVRACEDRSRPGLQHGSNHDGVAVSSSSPPHDPFLSSSQPESSQPSASDVHDFVVPPSSNGARNNPLIRLSKHLHVTNITPPEVPPSIDQVLFHWQLGASPSTYDWEARERALADEAEPDQEGAQKKRERERRKKERQAKRQKKENQLFTGRVETGKAESQPQLLRSSPGPASPALSSQVPALSQIQPFVVQSQVEPGRHGGRPMKKKKAKSRMSGF